MADLQKKSFWKNKETGKVFKVLDVGVWTLDLETRIRETWDSEVFMEKFVRIDVKIEENDVSPR